MRGLASVFASEISLLIVFNRCELCKFDLSGAFGLSNKLPEFLAFVMVIFGDVGEVICLRFARVLSKLDLEEAGEVESIISADFT